MLVLKGDGMDIFHYGSFRAGHADERYRTQLTLQRGKVSVVSFPSYSFLSLSPPPPPHPGRRAHLLTLFGQLSPNRVPLRFSPSRSGPLPFSSCPSPFFSLARLSTRLRAPQRNRLFPMNIPPTV